VGVPRLRVQLETLREVFENPQLGRLELAWGGYYLGEWAQFVALSIWAYEHGGAAAVGALGFVRMGAAALALPFGGALSDRYPRQRLLLGVYLARAATLGGTAAALAGSSPRVVVFALATLATVAGSPVRPATMSLVPLLARTPRELVAANVASSTLEGMGTLAGPLLAGALAVRGGVAVAVGIAALTYVACALLVAGIRRAGEVPTRPRTERSPLAELLRGAETLAEEPQPRLVVFLFGAQTLVRGLLNVLVVVAALDLLGLGRSGVGWLNAALGAGGLAGGLVAVGLVGRRRLALPFGFALVLWGGPIALVGAWPQAAWALVCFGAVGFGNALLDVSGFTLLQRTVDEHVLGRVFGVFEVVVAATVAVGSALGPVLVAELGIRPSLVVAGLALPTLAVLSYPRLRRIDASSAVPEKELALVSALELFAPLPMNTLERLAFRLQPVNAEAGTTIVAQGAPGELFYVIESGEVDVIRDGTFVATLGAGDFFGEIALLHCVVRTADCVARTEVELYALSRESFVAAVGADARSTETAGDVMTQRLAELAELEAARIGST
jgi:MFS family permease